MEAASGVGSRLRQPRPAIPVRREAAAEAPAGDVADWPRTRRILPWTLFAFVAMLWLVPADSIDLPIGTPVDATLDRVFLVVFAGIWLASPAAAGWRRTARSSPLHWAFASLIAVAVLSIVVNAEDLVRVNGLDLAIKQLALVVSYGLFFALAASVIRPAEIPKLVVGLLALASTMAVAVMFEYRFGTNVFHEWIGPLFPGYVRPEGLGVVDSIGRKQVFGPTVQPLAASVMLALALPFALAWLLESKRRRQRLLWSVVVVLLFGGALATQKKTSVVAPVVAIAVLVVYRPRAMVRLVPLAIVLAGAVHFLAPGAIGGVDRPVLAEPGDPRRHHQGPGHRLRSGQARPRLEPGGRPRLR